ncbi:MAG: GDSL-type esterase/lipase family protein [Myxococcota bacterium]|nr:GDSL-type esterase/lipase family protein [Myxococcota bacterium]
MGSKAAVFFALAILAGCSGGCDGERAKPPVNPKTPLSGSAGDPAVLTADVEEPASGYLHVPAGALEHLFRGLDAAEKQQTNGRVLMAFFGDSHTAGDSMTSRIRHTFQGRFGDAGRGLVAAGRPPARHYYQRDVRYGASGAWKAAVGGHRDPEPFGIAGLRVYGEKKGAQLWVETCSDCPVGKTTAQFEVLYLAAPEHGNLKYRVDDQPWQPLPTKTAPIEAPHPARHVIVVPDGPHKLTLEHAGGGVIDLFGVVLERNRPGVVVDSLGVVGRRLGSLRSWDWSIIGEQLATRDPRLVVLQYGTNESDDPDLDLEALAKYYDETILRIRAAAPTASIIILGPPDVATREQGKRCDRMKPSPDGSVIPECAWRTPNVLREIVAVEHAAAVRNKVVFFDTFAAMGGGDKMDGWFLAEPKLAYRDRVHFTDLGYQTWADALSGALLAEYDRWRRMQVPPR